MFFKRKSIKLDQDRTRLLPNYPASSRYAEAFRSLRTNLFFTIMEQDLKAVVVTSSVEGEGKTTTAANLAYTIAQAGRRVVIVDMDLRRPHMTSLHGLRKTQGVSDIVAGKLGVHLTGGAIEDFGINDLIRLTRLQNRTCTLDVESASVRMALQFEKGRITDIYWKNRPDHKKLATILIRENLLTEKEAALAIGHQKKSDQRLGTILYTMGIVSKRDIVRTLSVHVIEAIRALSAVQTGRFVYTSSLAASVKDPIIQDLDFEKLYDEFQVSVPDGYLSATIESAIVKTDMENLFVLPSGQTPPNPAELVGSGRTRFLIDYLKSRFDLVIIDTPPTVPVTDALLLTPKTDGAILVIRAAQTDRKIIQEAVDKFKSAGQPIIGTVLNRVDMKKEGYYRYYKKYYSSYYDSK